MFWIRDYDGMVVVKSVAAAHPTSAVPSRIRSLRSGGDRCARPKVEVLVVDAGAGEFSPECGVTNSSHVFSILCTARLTDGILDSDLYRHSQCGDGTAACEADHPRDPHEDDGRDYCA